MTAWIDHLLISVRDLDAAEARWAAHGLTPNGGGRHAAGTANRLIRGPGRCYVELIDAPADLDDPIATAIRRTEGPLSWAVGVDDLPAVRSSLAAAGFPVGDISEGSRTATDGTRFSWRVCGTMGPLLHPWAPFLIQWNHSMTAGPDDGPAVCRVTVQAPERESLARMLSVCGLAGPTPQENGSSIARLTDGEVDVLIRPGNAGLVGVGLASQQQAGPTKLDGLTIER
jgi:hypothetical protein